MAYAEELPKLVDEAIRSAITKRGVAVLEVPADFGFAEIDADAWYSSGLTHHHFKPQAPDEAEIDEAVAILRDSKRPVIYAGFGTRGHGQAVQELSRKIKALSSQLGKILKLLIGILKHCLVLLSVSVGNLQMRLYSKLILCFLLDQIFHLQKLSGRFVM